MVKGLKNPNLRRDSHSQRRTFARRVKNRRRPALETYKYDASGNILEKVVNGQKTNYSYDKGNQLASSTVNGLKTDYNYDAAGRMSSETTAGVTKTYTYGWLDKVVKVQAGESVTRFSYYADGQLAQKKSAETVENFYWDELALLRRGDTNYLNDPAVTGGNPILADNTILFTDMLGNTLGSVENEVFQPIGRTAFGETNSKLASANLDFFTGKPNVDGLGYNFLLRNYNAKAGKWQTQDPLGYPDGWNNFAYCNNWATGYIDIAGLTLWSSITQVAGSAWNSIVTAAANPVFKNTVSATAGALQIAAGASIIAVTGWSGIGAVAGVALMVQGTASLVTSGVNLYQGNNLLETNGLAGAVTSIVTDNDVAKNLATVLDMSVNLATGGLAVASANLVVKAAILPGSLSGYITEYNMGEQAYVNMLSEGVTSYNPSNFENFICGTDLTNTILTSINKMTE